jgi:hypothetical protein
MAVLIENGITLESPTHARIGYRDAITGISASSAASDAPATSALSWQTYERWRPVSSPATLTATFDAQPIDYIGIGAHTLSQADSVTFEVQVGGVWEAVLPGVIEGMEAADNEAIMLLMARREGCTGVRVSFTYTGAAPTIGKISAGLALTMVRPFYAGHSPAMLSRNTRKQPNVSEGGEWLGTSVIRQGRSTSVAWEHIPARWYRLFFDPFVDHARRYPFFFAWNPHRFPDCVYAMATDDVQPANMGIRDLMSVSLDIKGYSDGTQPRLSRFPAAWEEFYPEATFDSDIIDIATNQEWPAA